MANQSTPVQLRKLRNRLHSKEYDAKNAARQVMAANPNFTALRATEKEDLKKVVIDTIVMSFAAPNLPGKRHNLPGRPTGRRIATNILQQYFLVRNPPPPQPPQPPI